MRAKRFICLFVVLLSCEGYAVDPPVDRAADVGADRVATREMVRLLDIFANTADPETHFTIGSQERLDNYRKRLREARELAVQLRLRLLLGRELLFTGKTAEAIDEFLAVRAVFDMESTKPSAASVRQLQAFLAMAYLRLGEQENCIAHCSASSCVFPIGQGGVHAQQRGARLAINELTALLESDPDDLASRWLLSLAYMLVGEYPAGVPPQWVIPPATFESAYDVKPFQNIAATAGVNVLGLAGGSIVDDLDGDGWLDVMVSDWGMRGQLRYFRNNARPGSPTFTDLTDRAGLHGLLGGLNLCQADYDNDGDIDVFVLRGAWLGTHGRYPNSLLRNNGDGTFADVTRQAGLLSFYPTQTACWGDYDNDGWIDLFIGNEAVDFGPYACELYRNNRDGTFREVAAEVGVDQVGFVKGVAWGDYDNDGMLDLYLARMNEPNVLYHNEGERNGQWKFTDVSWETGVDEHRDSFATWWWDYDNDGWQDIFVASFPEFDGDSLAAIVAGYLDKPSSAARPALYRNNHTNGSPGFVDVAPSIGLHRPMLVMGANYGDMDNDGYLDAYLGTGEPHLHTLLPNRMLRNDAARRFQDVTASGGFGHLQKGHGISFGDIDNDGDQDIYAVMGGARIGDVAYNALFLNPGHGNRWITLRLEGTKSNRSAIGSRIKITVRTPAGTRAIHATVGSGGSFGASSLQQEIGLGDAQSIAAIEIRWPASKSVQRFEQVEMDRTYRAREGDPDLLVQDPEASARATMRTDG